EHVPTVEVQEMNGSVPGSTSVTVTLSAGSAPAFVIVITNAEAVPDVTGFGTAANVRTKSGSDKAAGGAARTDCIKARRRVNRPTARRVREKELVKNASNCSALAHFFDPTSDWRPALRGLSMSSECVGGVLKRAKRPAI